MGKIFRDLKPGEAVCKTHQDNEGYEEVFVCRKCLEDLEAHSVAVQGYHAALERQRTTIRALEQTIESLMVENETLKRTPPHARQQ